MTYPHQNVLNDVRERIEHIRNLASVEPAQMFILNSVNEALTRMDAFLADVPECLPTALTNAVKPSYGVHAECPNCQHKFVQDNGEWLIWCGTEEHAEAILKAAALLVRPH